MATHEILTVAEIAVELRCSKAHVYNVIAGKVNGVHPLPAICMGRRKLVRRATLEEWKRTLKAALGMLTWPRRQQSTLLDA